MSFLMLILGLLVGLYISHRYIVVPLWETERELRKELRTLRGELWVAKLEMSNLRTWVAMRYHPEALAVPFAGGLEAHFTPHIPHRAHSEVLPFDSIDALIEGTKP